MKKTKELLNITEVLPSPDMYNAFARAGYEWKQAIFDILDNSVDAIRVKYNNLPENEKKDFKGIVDIYCREKGDQIVSLHVVDNGCGVAKGKIPNVFSTGTSEKFGVQNSLGVFGMGLKTAGMSLATKIEFTSSNKEGGKFTTAQFDPEKQKKEQNFNVIWGPADQETTTLLRERIGSSSGTCVSLYGTEDVKSLPKKMSNIYSGLEPVIARIYRYILMKNSENYLPIKFRIGRRRVVNETSVFDCLENPNNPEKTEWYFGGPNFEFEEIKYQGTKFKVRASHTKTGIGHGKAGKAEEDGLGAGIRGAYKKGVYFIRGGREICVLRRPFWGNEGLDRVSNFFIEVHFEDSGTSFGSYIKTDFGKKGVVVEEGFAKFMKETFRHTVDLIKEWHTSKPAETTVSQDKAKEKIEKTLSEVFKIPRSEASNAESQETKNKNVSRISNVKRNKYVGKKLDSFEYNTSEGHKSNFKFIEREDKKCWQLPFWEEASDERGVFNIVLNVANHWIKNLFAKGKWVDIYPLAASLILSSRVLSTSDDERMEFLTAFGYKMSEFTKTFDESSLKESNDEDQTAIAS